MKPTQIIELLKNIKATFMSFFSIMMFVALSVAIFCGISWTGPALQSAAEQVFEEGKLHDFEITYPYGLTDENYEELLAMDGIDEVEGGYLSFQTVDREADHTMKVLSLTKTMDLGVDVKGRLPEKKGEIAVNSVWAEKEGIEPGDVLTFSHDGEEEDKDGMKYLVTDTYTVTAVMDSPAYVYNKEWSYGVSTIGSGTIDCLGWVHNESFDKEQFPGYVQTYIRSDALRNEDAFSKKYDDVASKLTEYLTEHGENSSQERFREIKEEAMAKIEAGAKVLEEAKIQIEDGKVQIAEGENQLAAGRTALAEGWQKLQKALAALEDNQEQYDDAKALYKQFGEWANSLPDTMTEEYVISQELMSIIDDVCVLLEGYGGKPVADEIRKLVGDGVITVEEYSQFKQDMMELKTILSDALSKAKAKLSSGWSEYHDGLAEYESSKQALADGEALLAEKKLELEAATKEYEEGEALLEESRKEAEALKEYGWTILSRNSNGGVQAIQMFSGVTDNLRFSMAMLFIIIGLLVSYSSISRIVKDQIVSLGTKKALGLRSSEITLSYLAYSGAAVLVGAVIGLLLGTFAIEQIIASRLGVKFIMGTYASRFVVGQAVLLLAVEMSMILATTWFACRSTLKLQAVELLKGPKPPAGKERFFEKWSVWEKLSLLNKTIVNNCFNDKRRVLGTIIGVAGCTALMVTAVTMNDNIQKSFTRQYENVYHYDTVVRFNALHDGVQQQAEEKLETLGASHTPVRTASFGLSLPDGKKGFVNMTVPFDGENIDSLYPAVPVKEIDGQKYEDGVWLNDAYERHFDAKAGDRVTITDSAGQNHIFTIEGFFEHHLISYQMIMSREVYEKVFDEECKANALLADSSKNDADDLGKELEGIEGIIFVKNDYRENQETFTEFSQISGIVIAIYLVLAALMAIVVLLDLNIVCIEEKKRELIVLMINGFSIKDARRYIYRDTIALTAVGIILGVILGSVMGNITVLSIEPNETSFVLGIDWKACLVGAASSAVLAYIMSKIALQRIAGFSLTDINKM